MIILWNSVSMFFCGFCQVLLLPQSIQMSVFVIWNINFQQNNVYRLVHYIIHPPIPSIKVWVCAKNKHPDRFCSFCTHQIMEVGFEYCFRFEREKKETNKIIFSPTISIFYLCSVVLLYWDIKTWLHKLHLKVCISLTQAGLAGPALRGNCPVMSHDTNVHTMDLFPAILNFDFLLQHSTEIKSAFIFMHGWFLILHQNNCSNVWTLIWLFSIFLVHSYFSKYVFMIHQLHLQETFPI